MTVQVVSVGGAVMVEVTTTTGRFRAVLPFAFETGPLRELAATVAHYLIVDADAVLVDLASAYHRVAA